MGKILDDGAIAIPNFIKGFPYPERDCPYCERAMVIETSCHVQDQPEHYKVIFQCHNKECDFLQNITKYAYVRVYYSSDYAEEMMWKLLLRFYRKHADDPSW
jgi:hypothetical protein